jgi:formamidase
MNGLGGLNKSPNGVVFGVVQLQLPAVVTRADLAAQTQKIVATVGKARRNMATMDLVIFPEYSLHGLSMDMNPEIMCSLGGPEIAAFKDACRDNRIWGCFSIIEFNPYGNPYNSGVIIDDTGMLQLFYRKMHPGPRSSRGGRVTSAFPSATAPTARSSRSSSATTACFPRWRVNAPTRAPRS